MMLLGSKVKTFTAVKSVPKLRKSKVEELQDMPYFILHHANLPLGERFILRKYKKVEEMSQALRNSGLLRRDLTDAERTFPFVKAGNKEDIFHVFGRARK